MTIRNLDALLRPTSVVLIGASPQPGSVGNIVARNLLAGGFAGALHFVNPNHAEVEGRPCHATIAALPVTPDLAVIATPPATVPALVSELGAKGVRAAVIITAGFTAEAKLDLLQRARPTCLRLQGPNCLGLMLPDLGLDASFSHRAPLKGDLALLSQSGALITSIIDWAASQDIGFSHVVSLGDMADVDFGDLLDYLAGDIHSRAILLYIEAITHAPKFLSAARRAARAKPVIVIKSGRHSAGAKAAQSHTGALAGSDAAYEAAFRRAGIVRVRELEQLFDAAEILSRAPRLSGERLTILTNGGGAGVLATDCLADWHGVLAPLSATTLAELDAVLPKTWSKANPVDIIGDATPERYGKALNVLLEDDTTDAILVMNCPTALSDSTRAAQTVADAMAARSPDKPSKPLLSVWLGEDAAAGGRAILRSAGVPTFESPDDAVGGFMQLVRHRRAQFELMTTPPSLPEEFAFATDTARSIIASALASGTTMLSEVDAKALLSAYGIPVVATHIAATPQEVAAVAANILQSSTAVALKILSPDITHKSDVGGVALNLDTVDDCVAAAHAMLARVRKVQPSARVSGFTVQPMIKRPHAHELIAGMSVDATFGPLILFGAGGTAVEVVRDTAQALPPLDLGLAQQMMRQTRVFRLLSGYRDRAPADLEAIALVLVRLSYLIAEHPEIHELDINPLLADDKGVIVLDARVRVADPVREPRVAMSIRPYPTQWEADFDLGGEPIRIRPIRPEDERLYDGFFSNVSAQDMRMRFFMSTRRLSHAMVARLTQIDYQREMAFTAINKTSGQLLGVARFIADPDYTRGEFAVLVSSNVKGKGLGWRLMQHLIAYAKSEGLRELHGQVLAENTAMLRMSERLGFVIGDDPDDRALRLVRLDLDKVPPAGSARAT